MPQTFEDLGDNSVIVVGAGLVGCLMACYLRKIHGYDVHLFEKRDDIRKEAALAGRSINLVITSRGIDSLRPVGLVERMLNISVPVYGRMLHSVDGELTYQPYGPDKSYCNYSISRSELNKELLSAAEEMGVNIYFDHGCDHLDVEKNTLYSYSTPGRGHICQRAHRAAHVFGCDGGPSRTRQALKGLLGPAMDDRGVPLGAAYKEMLMPPNPDGSYKIEKNALHIWPRGTHFLMALPDLEGSFTMTLYLPEQGDISFKSINTPAKVRAYFKEYYRDSIPLMPNYIDDYLSNPNGFLATVYSDPWCYSDNLVLVGDSAHGIVPFFGQGCNSGFEDVKHLSAVMSRHGRRHVRAAFAEYAFDHKPDGDAIAKMAIQNYYEMMDKTGQEQFLFRKAVENEIAKRYPIFMSRYGMVTHSLVRYHLCVEAGLVHVRMLDKICEGISTMNEINWDLVDSLISSMLLPFLKERCGIVEPRDYEVSPFDSSMMSARL